MLRGLLAVLALMTVSGCEVYTPADPAEIARAVYVSDEPPSVSLLSMVDARTGRSAHAALLINGSQRVLYDPAGTFAHPELPRAGDIHYGVSPKFVDYYERYHARFSHFVHVQTVQVDRATADRVLANARSEGKTLKMHCGLAVAGALRGVPLFQDVRRSYFPEGAREDFARIPGVAERFVYEDDSGKNRDWEQAGAVPLDLG